MIYRKRNRTHQKISKDGVEEILFVTKDRRSVLVLNSSAYVIWEHCDGKDLEQIIDMLLEKYNLEKKEYYFSIKEDCTNVLGYLSL